MLRFRNIHRILINEGILACSRLIIDCRRQRGSASARPMISIYPSIKLPISPPEEFFAQIAPEALEATYTIPIASYNTSAFHRVRKEPSSRGIARYFPDASAHPRATEFRPFPRRDFLPLNSPARRSDVDRQWNTHSRGNKKCIPVCAECKAEIVVDQSFAIMERSVT